MKRIIKLKQFGKYCAEFLIFCIIVFSVFGVICYVLDKQMIWDIYLPGGKWNDEVFYYKQIESVIHYGVPKGYFGYNESHADLLTLGPWSPFLLLPYVIGGKLIGWNYFTPILLNLLMFACALYIFLKTTGCTVKQQLCIYAVLMASGVILRYMLSGMVESVIFSVVLIVASLVCKLVKESQDKNRFEIWILIGICFYATLMRPYLGVLFLYPIFFLAMQKRKGELIGAVSLGMTGILVYFWISNHLCAPYFTPIINLSFLNVMKERGLFAGIREIIARCYHGGEDILSTLVSMFVGEKSAAGKSYLLFFLELIFLAALFLKDRKKKGWKDPIQMLRIITIGIFLAILSAVLIFYGNVQVGNRHLFACLILGTIVLFDGAGRIFSVGVTAGMCLCGLIFRLDGYTAEIPYRSTEMVSMITESEEVLQQYVQLDLDTDEYWNNTVAYEFEVPYNVLYGIPAGIGIQLESTPYLLEMEEPVKSKYLIVVPGGELSKRLTELNATLLRRTESFELFLNPRVPLYRTE